jgi:hypothetical protein
MTTSTTGELRPLLAQRLHHVAHGDGGIYRTHYLHSLAMVHADLEGDRLIWRPASKAALRRALATREEEKATETDVELALRQARSQRLITRESDWGCIVLTGLGEEVAR